MRNLLIPASLLMATTMFFSSCSKEENITNDQAQNGAEISRTAAGMKTVAYVEVNDINPLNAGSYVMDGNAFYDYVIIFAANIRGDGDNAILHFNENITAILGNTSKYIVPLQNKGIKVLLSVLGDHTGLGFANLTDAQADQFATALSNAVTTYNLDGIDFDDEYADYGKGYPAVNDTSFSNLVNKLRNKLAAGKLITVFDWGYSSILGAAVPSIDYAWAGYFGSSAYTAQRIPGLPNSKFSPQAINLRSIFNSASQIKTKTTQALNAGMGAVMTYDLRDTNHATMLNAIGTAAFGKSVTYNGESFSKDW